MIADDVKVIDFGLANLKSILQRRTDFMAGTLAYVAPEQIEGRPTDGRADLYSLGVMLFEMISGGHLPFDYADEDEILNAHLHAAPPPISQYTPTIPPLLEQAIMRLLAKDPEDRYLSADAVMDVLDSIPVGPKHSNLPIQPTPFVGRGAVLAEIADRLQDPDCRLLTLVGPGGSGKTRLALETGAAQLDNYTHGVWFVSLAPLQSVEAIVPTVADALGFRFYADAGGGADVGGGAMVEPQQQLLDYLLQKSLLLIMNNYEHLLGGAGLVTEILKTAPDVKVLATSRARLNVGGEHRFQITGMDFPELPPKASADAVQYSAVKLFLQGARRAQPGFELTDENLGGVVDVCRVVEGMPLAIRLAAAWVEMLSPQEIAAEISQGIDFLETGLHDVPERQRSMRAVFDHSWNLLAEREREVLQALSVFRGGFTREAAQEVTGASLRELMALVNKSLLQRTSTGRYEVHELLRQYAADKLGASGEVNAARDAHSVYYARFLNHREEDLKGRRQLGALDEIEADLENVRTAWIWALEQKNYTTTDQMLRSLGWFCAYRSRYQEYRELFQQAREQLAPGPADEPHSVWGRILLAGFHARHGEVDRAQIERGLAIVQDAGDPEATVVGLRFLGEIALNDGDYAEALSCFERSLAICRDLNDSFNVAGALYELAETYRLSGQPGKALGFARQSLELSREIGDRFWAASSLVNTGVIAFYTGNYTEAEGYLREANTIYREMGYRAGIASSNVVLSKLAHIRGDHDKGRALAEEALEIATDIGSKRVAKSALDLDRFVAWTLGEKKVERLDEEKPVPITDIPPTIDRFEVKGLLGVGGVSAVYLAHDPNSGRDVAIKVANPEALKQFDWMLKGFRQAAARVKLSQHPAFPEIYDYSETADHVYIVVEYIEGKTLVDILGEQEGFLPERDVIEWAIQICDALTYLHSQRPEPIIFRNVKPVFVMVDHHGRIRLIDFLIAEPYRAGREQSAIGEEGYAPPEQYFGYTDARSDVYSLGATLHHLLTRRDPRKEKVFSFHDAPPRSLNPAISEELEAVILKAVEHNPEDRYQSAEEMKTALLACPESEGEQIPQAAAGQQVSEPGDSVEDHVASTRQPAATVTDLAVAATVTVGLIANRFEVGDPKKDLIGDVYRGTDTQTGQAVSIKALKPEIIASQPDMVARFVREGEALRQLDHPNIVKMVTAVEEDGQHYLVMEYVAGGSLRELLEKQGPLPIARILEIGLELADALTRAHHLGIIHRDLKPSNVLLAEDETARLTDFGHAHVVASPRLTRTGALMGSVGYLSPEACNGETLDNRADLWALGVLLYEMLAGELPFAGETLIAALNAILTQPVPDLASLRPDAPDGLVDLVYRMLEKDRHQRIPSARQVGAELEAILARERKE